MKSPRERLSLDFGWKFALGHACDPACDFGFGKTGMGTYAKSGFAGGPTGIRFHDSMWESVQTQHDWAVALPFVVEEALVGACAITRTMREWALRFRTQSRSTESSG